jgi:hypothetical protein
LGGRGTNGCVEVKITPYRVCPEMVRPNLDPSLENILMISSDPRSPVFPQLDKGMVAKIQGGLVEELSALLTRTPILFLAEDLFAGQFGIRNDGVTNS